MEYYKGVQKNKYFKKIKEEEHQLNMTNLNQYGFYISEHNKICFDDSCKNYVKREIGINRDAVPYDYWKHIFHADKSIAHGSDFEKILIFSASKSIKDFKIFAEDIIHSINSNCLLSDEDLEAIKSVKYFSSIRFKQIDNRLKLLSKNMHKMRYNNRISKATIKNMKVNFIKNKNEYNKLWRFIDKNKVNDNGLCTKHRAREITNAERRKYEI
ncbi:hypothetical protein [Sulfurimonas sp.]|uniref:hypothetical protein n=1 Tax=Sulfurimonas sp. TaxID=2022749 RepID=UPI002AB21DF1|nr:hypothetical protein [Sulfurimonas sp.]